MSREPPKVTFVNTPDPERLRRAMEFQDNCIAARWGVEVTEVRKDERQNEFFQYSN